MSTGRVTIAKIGGDAGRIVAEQVKYWAGTRIEEEPGCFSDDDWPESTRIAVTKFCRALRRHGQHLPMLYYCEYIDMWNASGMHANWLVPAFKPSEGHFVYTPQFVLACRPLPDGGELMREMKLHLRGKNISQEDRWLAARLIEAMHAWDFAVPSASLLVFEERLGPLITDEVAARSRRKVPSWLLRVCAEEPPMPRPLGARSSSATTRTSTSAILPQIPIPITAASASCAAFTSMRSARFSA